MKEKVEDTDDAEPRADFWSIQGDLIYRHHNEPRVQLYVPKVETFPIPLKYFDVTRSTHTDLDVMQETRVDDYWDVDLNRFHDVYSIERKTSQRICVVGGRLTKVQTTTRPDRVWPSVWTKIGKAAQNRSKKKKNRSPNSIKLDDCEEFT